MSIVRNLVKRNFFRDSLQLMQLSEEAKKLPGVVDAAIVMGTDTNKELLERLGLLTDEGASASENDMILAVRVEDEARVDEVLQEIESLVLKPPEEAEVREEEYYSVESALESMPDANLAVVSVPGEYARDVAMKFLEHGVHVHLFSDHVPIEHEVELKRYASSRGLFVLGPGAGTSIINGKAIAFANSVRRGPVGIVAAAGTGLQEVSVLLDSVGLGVSQGLGIGGNDVKKEVGGIMARDSILALERDPKTKLIMIVSKPPDKEVLDRLTQVVGEGKKTYVACFLGKTVYRPPKRLSMRIYPARSLHKAVLQAVKLLRPKKLPTARKKISMKLSELRSLSLKLSKKLAPRQRYIRALYTGGTLMYESLLIYRQLVGGVYSNAPLDERYRLPDPFKSMRHSVIDLGEEVFTAGRPHPMIDPTLRKLRIVEEAGDPEVAVITLDFVLGYGAHPDPVGATLDAIEEARERAAEDGREIIFMAHVCGTRRDPQGLREQEAKLRKAGVVTFPTNALMAFASALVVKKGKIRSDKLRKAYKEFIEV